jgi:thioredoxin-dependent peroxiredoxin
MLQLNDEAPDCTYSIAGEAVPLRAHRGAWLVLIFYPKADTPGCTQELQDFSRLLPQFAAENAHILSISKDNGTKHIKFAAKHGLTIALGSDEQGGMCEAFGVWEEKQLYGKRFMGIVRSTFLIDPQGRIAAQWRKVKVAGHAEIVLEAFKAAQ